MSLLILKIHEERKTIVLIYNLIIDITG